MVKNIMRDPLFLSQKSETATKEDACRLLNWERNEVPLNIGGYKYDKKTKTFPVFINYDKQENISDTTKYEDHFISCNHLIAISKSGRNIGSEDVQNFLHAKERGIDVQLEELDTEIEIVKFLDTVEYDYPKFHLSMDCFMCKVVSGDLVLKEHEAVKWLTKENLDSVDWLPADQGLVEKIKEEL